MHKAQPHEHARNNIKRVVRPEINRADASERRERETLRTASEVPKATAENGGARTIKGRERLESFRPVRKELATAPIHMPACPLEDRVRRVGSHWPSAPDEHFQNVEDGNSDVHAKSSVQGSVPASAPIARSK